MSAQLGKCGVNPALRNSPGNPGKPGNPENSRAQ